MPGVHREVIEHSLNVKDDARPVKQRLRRFALERKDAIKKELTKLLAASFIKEVKYPDWLANPVLVKKKNNKWRICVDYTDLNKACPKDPFGLPRIDQVVDSTAGCALLSFLDCYSGYHQISLKQKLAHYFQAHQVLVITSSPLGDIIHNKEAQGRTAKWALEMMPYDITFKPRTVIKSQALADFVAEWTDAQLETTLEELPHWTMYFNGSLRMSGAGAGVVLISPNGEKFKYVHQIHFPASHNVAEYEALLHGLRLAISLGIRRLLEVRKLEDKFDGLELVHVLRHKNEAADELANLGLKRLQMPTDIFVEHLTQPTVKKKAEPKSTPSDGADEENNAESPNPGNRTVAVISDDWRTLFIKFLIEEVLPADKAEAERVSRLSYCYIVSDGELHQSASGIFMRCVLPDKGGFTHLFVAIDKFTKWIEAKPVATIDSAHVKDFIQNIIYRFGISNRIMTDNGRQFIFGVFQNFCKERGIKICYASVAHPKSKGQVERANGMVLEGIKARVFDRLHPYVERWVQELPPVLWALRTSVSRATGQSPFFLVYGTEAVLPMEIDRESFRIRNYNESTGDQAREDDLNRLEEARDIATIQSARYLQGLRRYHNRNVRGRAFLVGDLVLRKVQTTKDRHKLSPLWEGPYTIAEVTRPSSYRLKMEDGRLLENSWNIEQLRPFYT
ncbi:uncharacterized protein LOC102700382 [Oryza brachyantha]|uniref:uncharacterized protein LOC102700382 n=1 Tax=Oryza brachyantha TaxID=4533 RepID=UPI0007765CB5|nr:uncharacterized protein LOC102700382 [Oryza brachyantha]